jgi:hypothetical protein
VLWHCPQSGADHEARYRLLPFCQLTRNTKAVMPPGCDQDGKAEILKSGDETVGLYRFGAAIRLHVDESAACRQIFFNRPPD